jgi:hypothetical protein
MRKQIIKQDSPESPTAAHAWLDVESLARVEVTSEDVSSPIELALIPGTGPGWRAAQPGEQKIRLLFDEPLGLRHIHLVFNEDQQQRSQEFVLLWSPDGGQSYHEIVRQQYNFSPPDTISEVEGYDVALDGVTALELRIVPDREGGGARASLAQLRLA